MISKGFLQPDRKLRIGIIGLSLLLLILVFVAQRFDYSSFFGLSGNSTVQFIFNRTIRFLINDNLVILLIFGLFYEKKYVQFGLAVEAFGFCFFLLPYFLLRFYTSIDHMQISFLHRLIINPTLMILIIPAIYLQKYKTGN